MTKHFTYRATPEHQSLGPKYSPTKRSAHEAWANTKRYLRSMGILAYCDVQWDREKRAYASCLTWKNVRITSQGYIDTALVQRGDDR